MTRRKFFNELKKVLAKDDVVFCVGSLLSSESSLPEESAVYYSDDLVIDHLAIALGMAMACKKRVVFICEDDYLLRVLDSVFQASISECTNFYILVVRTGVCSSKLGRNSLTGAIRSLKGMLFNLGFLVHDYTPYFENSKSVKQFSNIMSNSVGPLIGLVDVTSNRLYGREVLPELNNFSNIIKPIFEEGAH